MITVGMMPAVIAGAVLGGVFLVVRPIPWVRRLLPEALVLAVFLTSLGLGLLPDSRAGLALWRVALGSPAALALVLLAVWVQRARAPEDAPPADAAEALALGLVIGWLPATALVAPRARRPSHAARLAVIASAASAVSPIGGPVPLLLSHGAPAWSAWTAVPALACVLVAWPPGDRPRLPPVDLRLLGPGVLGIFVAWTLGPLLGVAVAAGLALVLTWRSPRPAPPGLARFRPVRLAVAAWLVIAFAQLAGITWGLTWLPDRGGTQVVHPLQVTGVAAGAAVFIEPFSAAGLLQRSASYPSAPSYLRLLCALPLALSPVSAIGIAMASHGWRVWKAGIVLLVVVLGIAVGWTMGVHPALP